MDMPTYIIEHLDKELGEWSLLEYKHISKIVGKENLWFTNIKDKEKLEEFGKVFAQSAAQLDLKKGCVLDPDSEITLETKHNKEFDYFIFGGILGDYPPRKRTKQELTNKINLPSFNIGKEQMSSDNAVYVVKEILDGKKLKQLKFQDELEIKTGVKDSVILPYKYVLVNGKPLISKELIQYIKENPGF